MFEYPMHQLSASGDSGMPEVVADPQGEIAQTFQNLGVCVVQQCAKIRQQGSNFNLWSLAKHHLEKTCTCMKICSCIASRIAVQYFLKQNRIPINCHQCF